jgi:hypothetical protein
MLAGSGKDKGQRSQNRFEANLSHQRNDKRHGLGIISSREF